MEELCTLGVKDECVSIVAYPNVFSHDTLLVERCPSADDPFTTEGDETNCANVNRVGGSALGKNGNLCHVDCANRGVCDYSSGQCKCFNGYYGTDCTNRDIRATYAHNTL